MDKQLFLNYIHLMINLMVMKNMLTAGVDN